MDKIIAQGAEAEIIHAGRFIIKHRVHKGYRHPELDKKLINSRTKSEAKLLTKASEIINSPKPFFIPNADFTRIKMPFIKGKKLSETLNKMNDKEKIMEKLGQEVAKLHNSNIIHGDLTTSNMILVNNINNEIKANSNPIKSINKNELINNSEISRNQRARGVDEEANSGLAERASASEIYIIDFGLGFISTRLEDKAVDIHLLKQALEAKHFKFHNELLQAFLKGYKKESKEYEKILEQLTKVEARGRYKH